MVSVFTAVYEPREDGLINARVIEIPNATAMGKTMEEARANLAAALDKTLMSQRDDAQSRASPNARIERIRIKRLAPRKAGVAAKKKPKKNEWEEIWKTLLEQGLIDKIPLQDTTREDHDPVPIEGKPISEEIIEGRR